MTDPYVVEWIKQTELMNTSGDDVFPSIAADSTGLYITYYTDGTVSGGVLSGTTDIVVMRMNKDGSVAWIKQTALMNAPGNNENSSIAAYDDGLYVTYTTYGTVSGGVQSGSGTTDIVVMRMNKTDGSVAWIKQTALMNTGVFDRYPSIAADSTGLYVTYQTDGTVSGGVNSAGTDDIVVMRMNKTDGSVAWIKQTALMNTAGNDVNPSITADSTGLYVTYQTYGTVSDGVLSGTTDIVVMRMSKVGTVTWIQQTALMNTAGTEDLSYIASDSDGLYVTYSTDGTVSGGVLSGTSDIVVMRMNKNGSVAWIKQTALINTSVDDDYPRIAADSTGLYVTYMTNGTVSGGVLSGTIDIVVMRMNKNGTVDWIQQTALMNTTGNDGLSSIAADSTGLYVTYQTDNTVSGGLSSSGFDIVVMRMRDPLSICLLEGTLVRTPTGSVPIELVKKGDYVLNQYYNPVRVLLTSKRTFQYKDNPTTKFDMDNALYTLPAGTLGATSNVYLTRHHKFLTSDGTMKKPEEYGLTRSELSEVCKTNNLYSVYHLRLEDCYNNHFIVNGDCIVEDWWDRINLTETQIV